MVKLSKMGRMYNGSGQEVRGPEGAAGGAGVLEWDTVEDGLEVAHLDALSLA